MVVRNRFTHFVTCVVATLLVCILAVQAHLSARAAATGRPQVATDAVVAFVNVNVVPMDTERVLERQTVIVRGDRISEIAPAASIVVPEGAAQVDGSGKFLMPGLTDMHVHLEPGIGAQNDPAAQQITLLLATGITTVRGMFGNPIHLALRDRIARGEVVGPTVFTSGPPLLGSGAPTPAAGEQAVAQQKATGYDLIKVHEELSPDTYQAIVAAARENIAFAGHVTFSVGLNRAIQARQSTIEHLDGYINALIADNSQAAPVAGQIVLGTILNSLDENKIPRLAATLRDAGVWSTPTLALFKRIVSGEQPDDLLSLPELKYIPLGLRASFYNERLGQLQGLAGAPASSKQRFVDIRNKLVRGLHTAGAKLVVGSDSPSGFLVSGFALHHELRSFVEAGLTPYQALEAATRNPAEYFATFMRVPLDFGTVAAGNRADLLLLDANPLADIANANRIAGVMVRGRWLPGVELQRMLNDLARLHAPRITGVEVKGKKLTVRGEGFDPAAVIEVDGRVQKTKNDSVNQTTILAAKKAGKLIKSGQQVAIEIVNPHGGRSERFQFTRP